MSDQSLATTIKEARFCLCGQIARKGGRDCLDCHAAYQQFWRIRRRHRIQVVIYSEL